MTKYFDRKRIKFNLEDKVFIKKYNVIGAVEAIIISSESTKYQVGYFLANKKITDFFYDEDIKSCVDLDLESNEY